MVYLNKNMKGGETRFIESTIQPKIGKALIFRHGLVHEGCPVLEGVKYVLRTDIMYRRKGM
ncbi:MAG: prolyl 4-hydroxylase [Maribacter sp.]|jgi:prolyl 4-hydroxylase